MNRIIALYSRLLRLYPRGFREEFAEEMQSVFRDLIEEARRARAWRLVRVCLKEFAGLVFGIVREYQHEMGGTGMNVETNEPAAMSKRDKWLALLPFLVFGVASILGKVGGFWQFITWVAANLFVVIGLVIGGLRGFPRWTYSYLGWTGVFSFLFQWSIFPLLVALGLILLLRRSFRPLRELARGIWNDWTLLSLTIYCLFAYVMLIYDENHHPYLILFMLASTAVVCGTIWQFMSSRSTAWRVFSLAAGFIAAFLIGWVCDNTWDWRGYYGFTDVPREMWYESLATNLKIIAIWSAMLFWPAIIALAHRPVKPPPPARA